MKNLFKSFLILIIVCSCNNKNRLQVDFGSFNPNDFEIYLGKGPVDVRYYELIYKDGLYYDINSEYGPNTFLITYKGQQQCIIHHLILNRRRKHRYKFVIFERNDTLFCRVRIFGKYRMNDTIPFTPIEKRFTVKNNLQVDFGSFNPNDFEIYLHPGIGWNSDRIEYAHPLIVYKDGIYNDFDIYKGPNTFFIKYKGQLQCEFSQFILNDRRKRRYKFKIFEGNDTLFCRVRILGKYRMNATIPFTPIEKTFTVKKTIK